MWQHRQRFDFFSCFFSIFPYFSKSGYLLVTTAGYSVLITNNFKATMKGVKSYAEKCDLRNPSWLRCSAVSRFLLPFCRGWTVSLLLPLPPLSSPVFCRREEFSRTQRTPRLAQKPETHNLRGKPTQENSPEALSTGKVGTPNARRTYERIPGADDRMCGCFFRCFELHPASLSKAYVPLYIETEDGNWLFWHLYTDSSWAFNTALHNWELFCRRRRPCNLVLITSSDIVKQMAIQHLRIIREKNLINGNEAPDSELSAERIFLSEAAAWFSSVPIKTGNLPISPKSKPLRSSPEDWSAPKLPPVNRAKEQPRVGTIAAIEHYEYSKAPCKYNKAITRRFRALVLLLYWSFMDLEDYFSLLILHPWSCSNPPHPLPASRRNPVCIFGCPCKLRSRRGTRK